MIFSIFFNINMSPWAANSTYPESLCLFCDGFAWLEDLGSSRPPPPFFFAAPAPRGTKFLIPENGTCDHLEWWGNLVRSNLNSLLVARLEEVDKLTCIFFCLFRPKKTNMNFLLYWKLKTYVSVCKVHCVCWMTIDVDLEETVNVCS